MQLSLTFVTLLAALTAGVYALPSQHKRIIEAEIAERESDVIHPGNYLYLATEDLLDEKKRDSELNHGTLVYYVGEDSLNQEKREVGHDPGYAYAYAVDLAEE
ncbi:hypothetical protein BV22DRAFT_1129407 [Leucogyrophana mollusca]|uniref:Uncharacterized protein n=1 Tax=Leucogyrophana mollusca TaxID=85980 RepID=A0ACB8BHZ0_9AGAM|nr:hypothetical protein BV22DRAFT_1129407 [Leucogyrophana mollusca]